MTLTVGNAAIEITIDHRFTAFDNHVKTYMISMWLLGGYSVGSREGSDLYMHMRNNCTPSILIRRYFSSDETYGEACRQAYDFWDKLNDLPMDKITSYILELTEVI